MATTRFLLWSLKLRCYIPPTVQTFRHIVSPPSRFGPKPRSRNLYPRRYLEKRFRKRVVSRIDSTKLALLRHQELFGDMPILKMFEVPDKTDVWPQATWGLKLGRVVSNIRRGVSYSSIRGEFEKIGFDFNPEPTHKIYKYESVLLALLQYRQLYGNMRVPKRFVVPHDSDAWPTSAWGLKLGITVSRIRGGITYVSMRNELESIGFDYSRQLYHKTYGHQSVKQALLRYQELYGDMRVPIKFKVPDDSKMWPPAVLGLRLGRVVANLRGGKTYTSLRDWLESIGFDYSFKLFGRTKGYDRVKQALLRYKELYGNMRVPVRFKVPDESSAWPSAVLGLRLGRVVTNIRQGLSYAAMHDELKEIGFDLSLQARNRIHGYDTVKLALLQYKELYGDMRVRKRFEIQSGDIAWPESLWGLRLGNAVSRIRGGISYASKREELQCIGFDYSSQRPSRTYSADNTTKIGLQHFNKLHNSP
jgi:hypothetical protein